MNVKIKGGIFSLIFLYLIINQNLSGNTNKEINHECLRCHSMATLGYKDTHTGILKDLSVNPSGFYNSNHGELECIECHSEEFKIFPHSGNLKSENLYCLNCHQDDPELFKYSFKTIEKDFKESIHFKKFGNEFTCFNCHDPHSFRINTRVNPEIKKTVLYDNQVCLVCHNSGTNIDFTNAVIPDLDASHQWLPHKGLHWKSVRCIDCHTETSSAAISHKILPKEEALKNCVSCHSSNSVLLQSLYKFQSKEERSREGFINAVILNNSYVIGATRNYYLNVLSFIIFGIVLTALFLHGYLRWNSKKRIYRDEER